MSLVRPGRLRPVVVTAALAVGLSSALAAAPTSNAATQPSLATAAVAPAAAPQAAAPTASTATVGGLEVENSFVSAVGWVKPGESYPSRIILRNPGATPVSNVSVTVTAPRGTSFTKASSTTDTTSSQDDRQVTWTVPAVPGGTPQAPGTRTLVLEHRTATLLQEPTLVWRELSTTATVTVGTATATAGSHGPKVIPPGETYETARYGDRPFPVVPVQYRDRAYQASNSGEELEEVINDPTFEGSTFNLFQEMSLGQLFPEGTVPSAGVSKADFASYGPGFPFTQVQPGQTCTGGATKTGQVPAPGTVGGPLYTERITRGVYNLPGNTAYYGADANGSAVIGSLAGVGALQNIDSGCGSAGKMVYDAAAIADPEIDYSDYDTDKDGVVDFFMAVFAGCGGNGASQLSVAGCDIPNPHTGTPDLPYDNVWPHSSSLEFYYTDPKTGLAGFTTDDQLEDLEGRPLWYTDAARTEMTTVDQGEDLKVFVRVGPYNVNPETAIDAASVISHEYGHSLGLPDFYSTGSRETYGDWNLMATDKSQNMDAFSRQELGWVVPQVLEGSRTVSGFKNSKQDIDRIVWKTPSGTPYTLAEGADGRVQNSEMYVAKLPGRQLLDAGVFESGEGASKTHAWWSGSGNDFGCAPTGGRNLDVSIPQLATVPAGSTVELSFKSRWDIEWDYDYGYVLTTTDAGKTYTSNPSEEGYTTSNTDPLAGNPNQNTCQAQYDNGLTGSSGSYAAGSEAADRKLGTVVDPVFVTDRYDISELAGTTEGALRFSYATDPGLARPGWFVDDLKVTVTEPGGASYDVLVTDLETSGGPDDGRIYNGGCREDLRTAQTCTQGWKFLQAGAESEQDHAYYLEMRDRSGFDFDGWGQADRGAAEFGAGLYLSYTDEAHGYGNTGTDDPPAQSPLDSVPEPGSGTPDLNDAAFVTAAGRSTFTDSSATPHVDNYTDPTTESGNWEFAFDCLSFEVLSMQGQDAAPASNLTGDVSFRMGEGCGAFNYGAGPEPAPGVNTAPTATATASPTSARTGETVTFTGSGTDAQTPGELQYTWSFGNGGGLRDAVGPTATHAFEKPGRYVAELTVTDPQGLTAQATVPVTVTGKDVEGNQRPTARLGHDPAFPYTGQRVRLSAAGTTDPETAASGLTYRWSFGDGGSAVDATGPTVKTRFRTPGARNVTLTVTDPSGASDTVTKRVVVRRQVGCFADSVRKQGSWRLVQDTRSRGGSHCDNAGRGAGADVLTARFAGPQVDVWHGTARKGGSAIVYVDGKRVGAISFKGATRKPRMTVHRVFSGFGSGSHTVRVVVKRGTAYVEGFGSIV